MKKEWKVIYRPTHCIRKSDLVYTVNDNTFTNPFNSSLNGFGRLFVNM